MKYTYEKTCVVEYDAVKDKAGNLVVDYDSHRIVKIIDSNAYDDKDNIITDYREILSKDTASDVWLT